MSENFLSKIVVSGKVYLLSWILLGWVTISCDEQLPIGLDFVEKDPLHVFNLDTVTVKLSTVYLDSLATQNTDRLLVGYHQDSLLGDIEARSYFLIGNDSLETPTKDYSSYQGAVFRLYYDNYWFYDTTQTITLNLYLLNNTLETNEDTDELYNTTSLPYDSVNGFLGKISFVPRPHKEYEEFSVDYTFGDSLFQAVVDEEDFISDDEDFFEKYKGFILVPEKSNGAILGFESVSSLVLKYIEAGEDEELVFTVGDNLHFNQVTNENSESLIAQLDERKSALSSEETENMAFMRCGAGLGIRIEFPYLHNLLQLSKDVYITQAYLIISPVYSPLVLYEPYPSTFSVFAVDKLNREYGQLNISPVLYLDQEYKEETFYQISVASYLNDQLSLNEDQGDALLLQFPESLLYNSVSKLSVGNSKNKYRSELKILILTLDQDEL